MRALSRSFTVGVITVSIVVLALTIWPHTEAQSLDERDQSHLEAVGPGSRQEMMVQREPAGRAAADRSRPRRRLVHEVDTVRPETRVLAGKVISEDGLPLRSGKVYAYAMRALGDSGPQTGSKVPHRDGTLDEHGRFHFLLPIREFSDNYTWFIFCDDRGQRLLKCRLMIRSNHLVRVLTGNHPDWYLRGRLDFTQANPGKGGMVIVQSQDASITWGAGRFQSNGSFYLRGDFVPWPEIRGPLAVTVRVGKGLGYEAASLPYRDVPSLILAARAGLPVELVDVLMIAQPQDGRFGLRRSGSPTAMSHPLKLSVHRVRASLQVGQYSFSIQSSAGMRHVGTFSVDAGKPVVELAEVAQLPGTITLQIKVVDEAGNSLKKPTAMVSLRAGGNRVLSLPANPTGSNRIELRADGLVAGDYVVSVRAPGMRPRRLEMRLEESRNIRVEMKRDLVVYLDPVSNGGFFEFGRTMLCFRSYEDHSWTVRAVGTGLTGGHYIRGLGPGIYDFRVRVGDWVGHARVDVGAGDTRLRIPIRMTRAKVVEGLVADRSGSQLLSRLRARMKITGRPRLPWEACDIGVDGSFRMVTGEQALGLIQILDQKGETIREVRAEACGFVELK